MCAAKEMRRLSPLTTPDRTNAVVEIHNRANSYENSTPSINHRTRRDSGKGERSRRSSKTDDQQNTNDEVLQTTVINVEDISKRSQRIRESWVDSDINVSGEGELPFHNQIKQGIMGFMENEIKKSDKNPIATLSAYVNSITESDENLRNGKSSRPSSGHKEKRSPSKRKKKRISSKHRSDLGSDFDITASSMSALEKVDDYLREYNKGEEVTLSGELEIENSELTNNNGSSKESKLKPRKRRKSRHEEGKRDKNSNTRDVSPRVFDPSTGKHIKATSGTRPVRPMLDLSSMLDDLGSDVTTYNDRHIDNPFSSPSPMTSPNDGTLNRAFSGRPDKIYVQRGGNFRAVARERVLGEAQRRAEERKYFRLSSLTPLDVAISAQGGWRGVASLCHGLLGGLSLMHLLAVCYGDGARSGHLSFHAAIIVPYSAAYYFLCACCMLSVFDSLDINGFSYAVSIQPQVRGIFIAVLYTVCMLITLSSRKYDEMIAFEYKSDYNNTLIESNTTAITTIVHSPPEYYSTWTHLSVWRAVLPIVAAFLVAVFRQEDTLYRDLTKLLQFKHSLQSIGG